MKRRACLVSNSSSCSCVLIGVKLPNKLEEAKVYTALFNRESNESEDIGDAISNGNKDDISYQWSEVFSTYTLGKRIFTPENGSKELSISDIVETSSKVRATLNKLGISQEITGAVKIYFYTELC